MGRAPTSGNCHTCRQRRVKCDKARPACDRCVRGGFSCRGYETVLRMQNHAAVAGAAPGSLRLARVQNVSSYPGIAKDRGAGAAKTRAQRPESAVRRAAETAPPTRAPSGDFVSPPLDGVSSINFESTPELTREPSASIPTELSLVGFVDDMAFSYFFQSYGWINMHSILLQDAAMRHRIMTDTAGGSMAQDSLRALCYGLLGRDKHIPSLQDAGRRVYGKAIAQLRAAITISSKTELATLVKPISLLGSYSITIEKDLHFTHHSGLARILEICGPEHFQTPDLLPMFESVRMTLIADAVVRRQHTFLAKPEWKTVPWALRPAAKSATSRLLDVLTTVPAIVQGVWGIMNDRIQWLAGGQHEVPRIEQPDAVAKLQAQVQEVRAGAAAWYNDWTAASPELAPRVLAWAYSRGGDDTYRPGLFGVQGPDIFDTSLADSMLAGRTDDLFLSTTIEPMSATSLPTSLLSSSSSSSSISSPPTPPPTLSYDPALVAAHMQDAALYTTVLVWAVRLDRYLAAAARSPTCVDFLSRPFRSSCGCRDTIPPQQCETVPPPDVHVDHAMAWNAATCSVTAAPVRCTLPERWPSPSVSGALPSQTTPWNNVLLPGDIRFVAHMRILSWLCERLPLTRGHMLGTLAAVGLAHCAHDVRPAEGHAEIAAVAVARVLDSTGAEGAADILLRRYEPVL